MTVMIARPAPSTFEIIAIEGNSAPATLRNKHLLMFGKAIQETLRFGDAGVISNNNIIDDYRVMVPEVGTGPDYKHTEMERAHDANVVGTCRNKAIEDRLQVVQPRGTLFESSILGISFVLSGRLIHQEYRLVRNGDKVFRSAGTREQFRVFLVSCFDSTLQQEESTGDQERCDRADCLGPTRIDWTRSRNR